VKYTAAGAAITIAVEAQGDSMRLTVSDNGPGIPPGREEAIFDKFSRGERESAIPGVGLGLAICRAIVEAHGGSIRAGRADEGGAAFIIALPLGVPPPLPEAEAEAAGDDHE
jgi:two-component system sensor histidine kinase KdpD